MPRGIAQSAFGRSLGPGRRRDRILRACRRTTSMGTGIENAWRSTPINAESQQIQGFPDVINVIHRPTNRCPGTNAAVRGARYVPGTRRDGEMANIEDRWTSPGMNGRRVANARHGSGSRWRARYYDANGRQHARVGKPRPRVRRRQLSFRQRLSRIWTIG